MGTSGEAFSTLSCLSFVLPLCSQNTPWKPYGTFYIVLSLLVDSTRLSSLGQATYLCFYLLCLVPVHPPTHPFSFSANSD